MVKKYMPLLFSCTFLIFQLTAQDKIPIEFGRVAPEDFNISNFKVDTTNGGVIIADVGSSSFKGNNKGWFSLIYKHQRRLKIINKNGFDLANVEIPLYFKDNGEEKIEQLKAITYNLEGGKITETKLNKDDIFKDKQDKNHVITKFTMPAVKEGSIIEYTYTINSDFIFNLQPWNFQGAYPRVWSEYEVNIPEFFEYAFLAQGYLPFFIKDQSLNVSSYNIRIPKNTGSMADEIASITGNLTTSRWVIKDVPALKEEKYTSSLKNHLTRIEFQLSGYKFPNIPYESVLENWEKANENLLKNKKFAIDIDKRNTWLDNDIKSAINGASNNLDKAHKIFYYAKNNIKCTGAKGIMLSKSIKDVFKDKVGSIAEVNMLLVAMLKHENISAAPVILSTVDHGHTNDFYPLLDKFNYIICQVVIDSNNYFLDATQPYLGFGKLASYCYNGHARAVFQQTVPLYFVSDALLENKVNNIILYNDSITAGKWNGNISSNLGYNESSDIRNKIVSKGKGVFEKELKSTFTNNYFIQNIDLEDVDSCEKSMKIKYNVTIGDKQDGDIIYFNPMIIESYKENPFKSTIRKYPVEMPYKIDETTTLYIEIPNGYEVDEIPKSAKATLNEADGYFEYLISKDTDHINFRTRIKLEKAFFMPDEYENLRTFFNYIVKKQSEQIVFKKKK